MWRSISHRRNSQSCTQKARPVQAFSYANGVSNWRGLNAVCLGPRLPQHQPAAPPSPRLRPRLDSAAHLAPTTLQPLSRASSWRRSPNRCTLANPRRNRSTRPPAAPEPEPLHARPHTATPAGYRHRPALHPDAKPVTPRACNKAAEARRPFTLKATGLLLPSTKRAQRARRTCWRLRCDRNYSRLSEERRAEHASR